MNQVKVNCQTVTVFTGTATVRGRLYKKTKKKNRLYKKHWREKILNKL